MRLEKQVGDHQGSGYLHATRVGEASNPGPGLDFDAQSVSEDWSSDEDDGFANDDPWPAPTDVSAVPSCAQREGHPDAGLDEGQLAEWRVIERTLRLATTWDGSGDVRKVKKPDVRVDVEGNFTRCARWNGPRSGYVFTTREHGTGY